MTAKEMLEELGYKIVKDNEDFLIYEWQINPYTDSRIYSLCFRRTDKNIILLEKYDNGEYVQQTIPIMYGERFKDFSNAVIKQMEELGW